jgi:uncharacterized protein
MSEVCLVVFCRQPRIGVGKQRLAATMGADAAYRIAAALWQCVREDLLDWQGDIVLAVAENCEMEWAQAQASELRSAPTRTVGSVRVLPQPTGNLGERLQGIDCTLRTMGAQRIVYIGSDAPALSTAKLTETADALQNCDVVLVPAMDGGVVVMAARAAWPVLTDLPWSTDLLGHALENRCRARHMSLTTTQTSFDVDAAADLSVALAALHDDPRPARRALCAAITATLPTITQ